MNQTLYVVITVSNPSGRAIPGGFELDLTAGED
jgi:hypothetical protein